MKIHPTQSLKLKLVLEKPQVGAWHGQVLK
jgi:hypothetical protein